MAGTINLALTQQLDEYGQPLGGGQLYIIQAGTISTPQQPYQDTALSIPMPNPITLDAAGRVPQFFLADGQIKVRLQDVNGIVKFQQDNLLVIGPSAGGGGGGGSVDPTTVLQTGDLSIKYDTAIRSGFVRLNGKTIGSASSGATELADPSAQALFNFLWLKDSTLVVTPGGRGASGAADWAANKQITLPDGRGRNLMALGDMGNSDVGLLAGVTFGKGNTTTLGSYCGAARHQNTQSEMVTHYHYAAMYDPTHGHSGSGGNFSTTQTGISGGGTYFVYFGQQGTVTMNNSATGVRINAGNGFDYTGSAGGGVAYDIVNPSLLITVYMKL